MLVTNAAILGAREAFVRNVAEACGPLVLVVIFGVVAIVFPKWMDRKVALYRIEVCFFCSALTEFLLINIPAVFSPIQVVIPVFWMVVLHCPSVRRWRSGQTVGLQVGIGDFLVANVAVAIASTLWVLLKNISRDWPVAVQFTLFLVDHHLC